VSSDQFIKVWMEGSPGGSMWPMPSETWEKINDGSITDTSGLFVSVADAIRIFNCKSADEN
jgi:hypothetical protein